jgi:hypothetical protein
VLPPIIVLAVLAAFAFLYIRDVAHHPDADRWSLLHGCVLNVSRRLETFRRQNSRHPTAIAESRELEAAIDSLRGACERSGHPIGDVKLVGQPEDDGEPVVREILVASDKSDRPVVVFYQDGGIAMSRLLLGDRAERVSGWIDVLPE